MKSVAVAGKNVIAGTSDGVFVRPLDASAPWRQAGLPGAPVKKVFAPDPAASLVLIGLDRSTGGEPLSKVPIWRSTDEGQTWQPADGAAFLDDAARPGYPSHDTILDIVAAPSGGRGAPVLYANASANSVAMSKDSGLTWKYVTGTPGSFGYDCYLAIGADAPSRLLQGCELPLDSAWIADYDLTAGNVASTYRKFLDDESIGNRRPNGLATFGHVPSTLYAGLEGALVHLDPAAPQNVHWIFKEGPGIERFPYTYVNTIWVDPCDAKHVVFGGLAQAGNETFQTYETFDDGVNVALVAPPPGIHGAHYLVRHGVPTGEGGRDLVIVFDVEEQARTRGHVLVREHGR